MQQQNNIAQIEKGKGVVNSICLACHVELLLKAVQSWCLVVAQWDIDFNEGLLYHTTIECGRRLAKLLSCYSKAGYSDQPNGCQMLFYPSQLVR